MARIVKVIEKSPSPQLTPAQLRDLMKRLEEDLERADEGYWDNMDDPTLFENYKCEPFNTSHCILIPTDSIPFFTPFSEHRADDELYNLDQFQSVVIPTPYLPVLVTIVEHLVNCILSFTGVADRVQINRCRGEEKVRAFFAILAEQGGYMHHWETSIYFPDVKAFGEALQKAYIE